MYVIALFSGQMWSTRPAFAVYT